MPRLIPGGAGQGKIGSGAAAGCSSRLPGGVQREAGSRGCGSLFSIFRIIEVSGASRGCRSWGIFGVSVAFFNG